MENRRKTLKKWKLFKTFFVIGFLFWISETIIFLFIYGWHLKATEQPEVICDNISLTIYGLSFIYFFSTIYEVIEYLLSTKQN